MRQIKQMLRLARDGVSSREIGRTLGIARSTVQDNLARASAAGLTWPLGPEVTDAVLEQRLFARTGVKQGMRRLPEPEWRSIVREMRRPGVNLTVLWEEANLLVRSMATNRCSLPCSVLTCAMSMWK